MGIHGIYKEIGPGQRIALSKLAVEKFEATGRPLRIAIDVSIWLFQIQASKGGTNPALRTFYYRLLRLISLSIHPIFVFDGPNKPPFKRNKRTGPNIASIPDFLAKKLLKQFGFPIHLAPGEAEAECALLQREGIVDAVLSEDVDTLMFGSGITIRNWSPEQKSNKTPTHVNLYDAVQTKNGPSGLDREGMILVALMSGGDYIPEGIPGCGPKTACEAARAGFGKDLCKIKPSDIAAMREWRERLQHELKTNESKFFKRRHGTLVIPEDFPRTDILGYYTHPAISTQSGLEKLKRSIKWDQELDFLGLREFAKDAFGWQSLEGAKHFIRCLTPSLLVRSLRLRGEEGGRLISDDLRAIREDEAFVVKGIHGKRQHASTDNSIELRVSCTPIELVKINLDNEEADEERPSLESTLPSSTQVEGAEEDLDESIAEELEAGNDAPKKRSPTKFDPTKPLRVWVMESYVKVGVPLKVEDWEAAMLRPKRQTTATDTGKAAPRAKVTKRTKVNSNIPQGSIYQFANVTKPGVKAPTKAQKFARDSQSTFQPLSTQASRTVVNLLFSSPVKPTNIAPRQQPKEKSPSPAQELPPSVTKRRRRCPMQRSHTLPADISSQGDQPLTPGPLDVIETLDLVSPPALPSPAPKKAKTCGWRNPPVSHTAHQISVLSSPGSGKSKQTILDAWSRASPAGTPTKSRRITSPASTAPAPATPQFQAPGKEIETLDLTLSSPPKSLPTTQALPSPNLRRDRTRKSSPRPPLQSISSNTLFSSSSTRVKPPMSKTRLGKLASPELDSLDLIQLSSPPSASPVPNPVPSFTFAASRRSPRNKPSPPPAAWKTHARKTDGPQKRNIILRKSLVGYFTFVDAGQSPGGNEKTNADAEAGVAMPGARARKKWRESEVEVLDLS
ncbi:hypothetical protein CC78DRAFT_622173 [Lojkania enalia]|uniref:Flap structure-specific endonuclease n=1 Tax=Lojkania enalia TaxID=147567 RepID=A0A9P4MXZ2_9PLEO|nr:hypothetical protein CC78DRAFT_622173 [Didymosphaeria enalia]